MNQSVLLLDDNEELLSLFSEWLRRHGLHVHQASRPEVAIEFVRTDHVGVAILDVKGVDGLDTARRIHDIRRDVQLVFLSAFLVPNTEENAAIRNRAAQIGVTPWAWIDKGVSFQERTLAAISSALGLDFTVQLSMRLQAAAAELGLAPELRQRLVRRFDAASIVLPPAPVLIEPFRKHDQASPLVHEEVLQQLSICLQEAQLGYGDIALRRSCWDSFVTLVLDALWLSLDANTESHRRQLVVQLQQAVRVLHPDQLAPKHLDAAEFTLGCLRNGIVSRADVTACKRVWRETSVETLPDLAPLVDRWAELYPAHAVLETDDEEETTPGDNDSAATLGAQSESATGDECTPA